MNTPNDSVRRFHAQVPWRIDGADGPECVLAADYDAMQAKLTAAERELQVTNKLYKEACAAAYDRGADIETIATLARQLEEARRALCEYGVHKTWCSRWRLVDAEAEDGEMFYDGSRKCTCGLSAALPQEKTV